jgi:hypothetical protein
MHYCSAEIDYASQSSSPDTGSPKAIPSSSTSISEINGLSSKSTKTAQLQADLDESLDDLEQGLDVLFILQRAYDQTIKAQVGPDDTPSSDSRQPTPDSVEPKQPVPTCSPSRPSVSPKPKTSPLLHCSATAFLAVLDCSPSTSSQRLSLRHELIADRCTAVIKIAHIGDCMGMLIRGEEILWRSEEMWYGVRISLFQ